MRKLLEVYSMQLVADPFVYALEVKDIEAALLLAYKRVSDGITCGSPRYLPSLKAVSDC